MRRAVSQWGMAPLERAERTPVVLPDAHEQILVAAMVVHVAHRPTCRSTGADRFTALWSRTDPGQGFDRGAARASRLRTPRETAVPSRTMPRSPFRFRAAVFVTPMILLLAACGDEQTDGARVSFTQPADGATVAGGLAVEMSAEGITIEEAGEVHGNAGHFHVIADHGCVAPGETVTRDADHVHFGGGQAEGTIYLEPGTHELCLQPGDGAHAALDATDTVTVTIDITGAEQWCAVVGELEDLFDSVDASDDPFEVKQLGYENVQRLFAQLSAGVSHLDADIREAIQADIAFGSSIATAFIEASDLAAADAALLQIQQDPLVVEGVAAVNETCDVDLGG